MTEFEAFPTDFARIDEVGLVAMIAPKAASTAIMEALARSFAPSREGQEGCKKKWRAHGSPYVPSDYLSVGFCRHPVDRFVSCWRDKIATVDVCRTELAAIGCRPGMSLDDFAGLVAETEDCDLDKHLIPQGRKFFSDGALRVQELFRYEELSTAWDSFRLQVRAHCGRYLAELPRLNASKPVAVQWSEHSRQLIRERYKHDLVSLGYE